MATTVTATERDAIATAVQTYIDGARERDAAKLHEVFHEQAWMFGAIGGQRIDVPIGKLIEMIENGPPIDADGSYKAEITFVEQVGDAATATLEEEGCWGSVAFTDFFSLAKINGTWKIVNKTFAHTGGEMPGA